MKIIKKSLSDSIAIVIKDLLQYLVARLRGFFTSAILLNSGFRDRHFARFFSLGNSTPRRI